jgi:DNA-binding beta-propeller fold protein YncE
MNRNGMAAVCSALMLGFAGAARFPEAAAPGPRARAGEPTATAAVQARGGPRFEVDPLWPKPLPNHWLFGSITGVAVDANDHVWVVHRGADSLNARTEMSAATTPPTAAECCRPAPVVLEFDPSGALLGHWGGPGEGYAWPRRPGGITVDADGNVWIAAAGAAETARGRGDAANTAADAHILKFSGSGSFLLQIGRPGQPGGNDSRTALHRPAAVDVDKAANEVYVADGFGNRRVVVFDATTGAYKRHWGAYGAPPQDADPGPYSAAAEPARQFRSVTCVRLASDGLVYVCDRGSNRIQVFRKDGRFVNEVIVSKPTLGEGSVWDVSLSRDSQQRYLFVADGQDQRVFVVERSTLRVVSEFGGGGRWPGGFYGVGSVAVDSKGNVYTGENFEGKRLQKFVRR